MGRKPFNNDVVDGSGQDKSTSAMAELRKLRFDPVTRDLCPGATTCGRARAATCPILSKTTAKPLRIAGKSMKSGLLTEWRLRLVRQERRSMLCCRAWRSPLGDFSCRLLAILTLNPDPDCQIGITGAARQPVAFSRAASDLRIGSEELDYCRKRIAISTKPSPMQPPSSGCPDRPTSCQRT